MKLIIAMIALAVAAGTTEPVFAKGEMECESQVVSKVTKKKVSLRQLHNPNLARVTDYEVCFEGYVSNFDGKSEGSGDENAEPRRLRVPLFVTHHVPGAKAAPESRKRPTRWFTIDELVEDGTAPTHQSYVATKAQRGPGSDWYERGHLAQKYLLERVSEDAAWFSHNVANAVPQRARFNKSAWNSLECHVGAWANKYREVWVVAGPIFESGGPRAWLESQGNALPVAIPDSLFKIVLRKDKDDAWEALSFIMPQQDDRYLLKLKQIDLAVWGSSIERIERLTNQVFFPDQRRDAALMRAKTRRLWPAVRAEFDPSCRKFVGEDA